MGGWERMGGVGILLLYYAVSVFVTGCDVVCGLCCSPACGGRLLF